MVIPSTFRQREVHILYKVEVINKPAKFLSDKCQIVQKRKVFSDDKILCTLDLEKSLSVGEVIELPDIGEVTIKDRVFHTDGSAIYYISDNEIPDEISYNECVACLQRMKEQDDMFR